MPVDGLRFPGMTPRAATQAPISRTTSAAPIAKGNDEFRVGMTATAAIAEVSC
jgi:hypothetical protein